MKFIVSRSLNEHNPSFTSCAPAVGEVQLHHTTSTIDTIPFSFSLGRNDAKVVSVRRPAKHQEHALLHSLKPRLLLIRRKRRAW